MKTFVTLLAILLAMVFVVPAFAGEEPYKAAVYNDNRIPSFYIAPKLDQFTHAETNYYKHCKDILTYPADAKKIDPEVCDDSGSNYWICPSACTEKFSSKTKPTNPEVCCNYCTKNPDDPECKDFRAGLTEIPEDGLCPDSRIGKYESSVPQCERCDRAVKTSKTSAGNSGYYEWIIAVPKKPEGEINLEIECGVLKPNYWAVLGYHSIEVCAAETGEPIGSGFCTRVAGGLLNQTALPTLEVIAAPGCQNDFKPFHLTAYKNPSDYKVPNPAKLVNSTSMQVLNGSVGARIALKGCMEKTIMMKWPVDLTKNVLGETEANLEAGDIIKVRMVLPTQNTVDVYCSQYSVTLGGIGEPEDTETGALSDEDCDCITNCSWSTSL